MERAPSPLRVIIISLRDWWSEFLILGLLNFLYLLLLIPVITAPPATYALFSQARSLARHEGVTVRDFFLDMQANFLRAWKLGLVTILGSVVVGFDVYYYGAISAAYGPLAVVFLYAVVLWVQLIAYAWAMLTARPDLPIRDHLRNALIFTFRYPIHHLILGLFILLTTALAITLAFVVLILACIIAHVSLIDRAPELVGRPIDYVAPGTIEPSVYDTIDQQEKERKAEKDAEQRGERH